jgi:sortase (surface protein transpeptidase)
MNKVTKSRSPKQIREESIQESGNSSACASYTQHHPVLGDVEIPSSFTNAQINHLIETKIAAVKSAIRRQIDFYFR